MLSGDYANERDGGGQPPPGPALVSCILPRGDAVGLGTASIGTRGRGVVREINCGSQIKM